jgi:selenocysteine lyase/cysteine desulfurase
MTLAEILGDENFRRREFPVCAEKIFLAHAAVCPLPRRVTQAMRDYLAKANIVDQKAVLPPGWLREIRERAAQLIQAKPEEIALIGPTSLALSFIAAGLPLKKRDNVLIYQDDYPSNVYPWMALAEHQIQVRLLRTRELGRIELVDIMTQIDENTRLVALASCHFISGHRLDLEKIGAYLRGRGIAFCVDAIQTVGAYSTPACHADFMAADAHKWMLGPCSAGLMYVRREWQEHLRPRVFGWHNVQCPSFVAQDELKLRADARRYEAGTANLVGLAGLKAALEMILDIGPDLIQQELRRYWERRARDSSTPWFGIRTWRYCPWGSLPA